MLDISFAYSRYKFLGNAYQLVDDYLDDEQPKIFNVNLLLQAKIYGVKAKQNLETIEDSKYKQHFINLLHYISEKPALKQAIIKSQNT